MKQQHYNYIIAGAGCAGLSLLMHMMNHSFFSDKSILVIDGSQKKTNDRTWCFWETQNGIFEDIVYHRWSQVDFYGDKFSARYDIAPYTYKMIRGIDLYQHVLTLAKTKNNVRFINEEITGIVNGQNKATITTSALSITCNYVFNSIVGLLPAPQTSNTYYLQQHFKGWFIETGKPVFNPKVAGFMDFRTEQIHGTNFIYVLPITPNKALIEYTVFSKNLLRPQEYDQGLKIYVGNILKAGNYRILEEESGVIPMTNQTFPAGEGHVINIGTAGGQTKASSGFTFQFIQKHVKQIVDALITAKELLPAKPLEKKRFDLYDSTLLNILENKKLGGKEIFTALFKRNKPQLIFKFLDNETTIAEDLKLVAALPTMIFLSAALREAGNSFKRRLKQ